MKKIFISQPMKDLSKEEIMKTREEFINTIKEKYPNEDIEILNSLFGDLTIDEQEKVKTIGAYYLGKSIQLLGTADCIAFVSGWESTRGCVLEHLVAEQYGIEILCD